MNGRAERASATKGVTVREIFRSAAPRWPEVLLYTDSSTMNILGINAYHGNASAAILCDGKLIAAVEEERFNRVKYAAGFPVAAIRYCLQAAGITIKEVDHIAIPRDPRARLGTKLFYSLRMPSFALERLKVMGRFAGIPEALAKALDISPKEIRARYHRI